MSLKKFIALAVVLIAGTGWFLQRPAGYSTPIAEAAPAPLTGSLTSPPAANYADRDSGRMISAQGTVTRVLSDDRDGSPHQRFIIRMGSGQTLLVAHNLDLAERLQGLGEGDRVSVHGQYEWNDRGGLIHWTHDDPDGQHAAGYIDWNGRRYQ